MRCGHHEGLSHLNALIQHVFNVHYGVDTLVLLTVRTKEELARKMANQEVDVIVFINCGGKDNIPLMMQGPDVSEDAVPPLVIVIDTDVPYSLNNVLSQDVWCVDDGRTHEELRAMHEQIPIGEPPLDDDTALDSDDDADIDGKRDPVNPDETSEWDEQYAGEVIQAITTEQVDLEEPALVRYNDCARCGCPASVLAWELARTVNVEPQQSRWNAAVGLYSVLAAGRLEEGDEEHAGLVGALRAAGAGPAPAPTVPSQDVLTETLAVAQFSAVAQGPQTTTWTQQLEMRRCLPFFMQSHVPLHLAAQLSHVLVPVWAQAVFDQGDTQTGVISRVNSYMANIGFEAGKTQEMSWPVLINRPRSVDPVDVIVAIQSGRSTEHVTAHARNFIGVTQVAVDSVEAYHHHTHMGAPEAAGYLQALMTVEDTSRAHPDRIVEPTGLVEPVDARFSQADAMLRVGLSADITGGLARLYLTGGTGGAVRPQPWIHSMLQAREIMVSAVYSALSQRHRGGAGVHVAEVPASKLPRATWTDPAVLRTVGLMILDALTLKVTRKANAAGGDELPLALMVTNDIAPGRPNLIYFVARGTQRVYRHLPEIVRATVDGEIRGISYPLRLDSIDRCLVSVDHEEGSEDCRYVVVNEIDEMVRRVLGQG